jgi:hypothetical protein
VAINGIFNIEVVEVKGKLINLQVIFIKEGESIIAFSPALDISTCANSFDKARKRFEELVGIFFEELDKKGTAEEVLTSLGWTQVSKREKHSWIPPYIINRTNEEFTIPCRV